MLSAGQLSYIIRDTVNLFFLFRVNRTIIGLLDVSVQVEMHFEVYSD